MHLVPIVFIIFCQKDRFSMILVDSPEAQKERIGKTGKWGEQSELDAPWICGTRLSKSDSMMLPAQSGFSWQIPIGESLKVHYFQGTWVVLLSISSPLAMTNESREGVEIFKSTAHQLHPISSNWNDFQMRRILKCNHCPAAHQSCRTVTHPLGLKPQCVHFAGIRQVSSVST